jgi:outer membrane receptor for ferrienterochelin and colicins
MTNNTAQRIGCLLAFLWFGTALPPTLLAAPPAQNLGTVVVTGARRARKLKDTVNQTEVITRKQIEQTPARRLSELLETQLGVQLTNPDGAGTGINIQGLSSKHVLILVDGQRLSGRVRGILDLDRFPLEQIERVEIVKGATSALYGADAIGGVINIITRKNKRPFHANLSGRYGYGDGHLIDLNGSTGFYWKGWSGQLSLSWLKYDSWDLDPSDPATSGSHDHMFHAAARTSYRFSSRVQLSLRGDYQFRDRAGIDSNSVGAIYDRKNRTETSSASLFLNALLHSGPGPLVRLRWKANMAYFRDQFLYEQRKGDNEPTFQQTYDIILQSVAQLDVGIGTNHFISVGVDTLYETLTTDRLQSKSADRFRVAGFAQYEWMLAAPIRISVVPGIRAGYDTQFGPAINPKLSLRIDPVKGLAIRASYGWGFRAPDFKELYLQFENSAAGYVVVGNDQLQPELARSLQAGIEWTTLPWLTFRANFYYNDLEHLINTKNLPTQPNQPLRITYENIDSALTMGVETQVACKFQRYVQLVIGYTYLHSEDRSTGLPLLGRAPHRGNANLFLQIPQTGLRLTVSGTLVSPHPYEQDTDGDGELERLETQAYALLHARISYTFWHKRIEVAASLRNILNAGDPQLLPIRPRTFHIGLRIRY